MVTVIGFSILAILLIFAGLSAIIRGQFKLFGREYQKIGSRIWGVIIIVIGLFPAAIAFVVISDIMRYGE